MQQFIIKVRFPERSEIRRFRFVGENLDSLMSKIRAIFSVANDQQLYLISDNRQAIDSDSSLFHLIEHNTFDNYNHFKLQISTTPFQIPSESTVDSLENYLTKFKETVSTLNEDVRERVVEKCSNQLDTIIKEESKVTASNPAVTKPTPKPYGQKLATFIEDVSVADHAIMKPGEEFVKIWKFKNNGKQAIPKNSKLVFLKGKKENFFNSPEFVPLNNKEILVGQEFNVSVRLIAPMQPGVYSSYFRMADETGVPFGQKVWCCVDVK